MLVPQQLALFPVELATWIRDTGITIWYSVPSILTLLVLRGRLHEAELPALRTVLFAGEVFPSKYLAPGDADSLSCALRESLRADRDERVHLVRGASVAGEPTDSIPIGRAITGVETFAVGEDGSVLQGEVGELYVRGPTVMQGYWGDEERTQAALSATGRARAAVVYRTGDLAYLDDNGDWIFLGRRDSQIKSRGYRIELATSKPP